MITTVTVSVDTWFIQQFTAARTLLWGDCCTEKETSFDMARTRHLKVDYGLLHVQVLRVHLPQSCGLQLICFNHIQSPRQILLSKGTHIWWKLVPRLWEYLVSKLYLYPNSSLMPNSCQSLTGQALNGMDIVLLAVKKSKKMVAPFWHWLVQHSFLVEQAMCLSSCHKRELYRSLCVFFSFGVVVWLALRPCVLDDIA